MGYLNYRAFAFHVYSNLVPGLDSFDQGISVRDFPRIAFSCREILATAIAFCVGGWLGAAYCDRWIMPGWVKQYPHDGQLGLGMMMYAFNGGLIAGFILFVAGIVWTVKTSKGANNPLVK
jgi:hypothetical protein